MAHKTISLDAEAYAALARKKRQDQTFSEVIKAHFGRRTTGADLKRVLADLHVSEDTLDAIEEQIRARSESSARAPERAQRGVHLTMRTLREAAGKTQTEVAEASMIDQAGLSRLESRDNLADCQVSILQRYVAALGGQLELVAAFGNKRIILSGVAQARPSGNVAPAESSPPNPEQLLTMQGIPVADLFELPVAERLRLVELLWDSIAAEPEAVPITDELKAELDRRLADFEADPESGSPWEEVRSRILRRLEG
ncbi:MAG TPA: addiction module protein [Thermoanaerobaculia bacterium]|jgi:putative addiction module component (TIGR02574 family)|nr:addiction module protein [Thermoanaerobaculia bacterium]